MLPFCLLSGGRRGRGRWLADAVEVEAERCDGWISRRPTMGGDHDSTVGVAVTLAMCTVYRAAEEEVRFNNQY